jgi:hypothetical protein
VDDVAGAIGGRVLDWYSYDHDSRWRQLAERAANGLAKVALRSGDRAWYYTAFTQKGWQGDVSPSGQLTGAGSLSVAPTEPVKGSLYDNGNALYGLVVGHCPTTNGLPSLPIPLISLILPATGRPENHARLS